MVITDEQSHDEVGPQAERGYQINVACNRNGWVTASGIISTAGAKR
jgi:hypothetical protein